MNHYFIWYLLITKESDELRRALLAFRLILGLVFRVFGNSLIYHSHVLKSVSAQITVNDTGEHT